MQIEFISENPLVTQYWPPEPAKKLLPDWYKQLPQEISLFKGPNATSIKGCIPVQDMMTSGYIIKNAYEADIKAEEDGDILGHSSVHCAKDENYITGHFHQQCPVDIKDHKRHYFKVSNDWTVKTPPGYSCLFLHPQYYFEDRYTMFPAIVDTDVYDLPVQFTGVLNLNAGEVVTLSPGAPLVQVIPFKRDEWTMQIKDKEPNGGLINFFMRRPGINGPLRVYKKFFHKKKKFD